MPRLRLALPDADVCVVSPGLRLDSLAELCRSEGWSYLSTATNDVALAQNVCYRLHPDASMIVKLDEDMFLLPATISTLLTEYQSIRRQGAVDPGFVAPMIPLNGFCYRHLLEMLGLLEEYEARIWQCPNGDLGHRNPDRSRSSAVDLGKDQSADHYGGTPGNQGNASAALPHPVQYWTDRLRARILGGDRVPAGCTASSADWNQVHLAATRPIFAAKRWRSPGRGCNHGDLRGSFFLWSAVRRDEITSRCPL